MSYDSTKVTLGVCNINFNGTDLGLTIGGVEVVYTPTFHDTKADQFTTVIEKFLIAEKLEAKVPMAEFTLAHINKAIAQSTLSGGKVSFGSYSGKKASAMAHPLVLHPIANGSDKSEDVVIFKAVSTGALTISMKNDGEKIIMATFEGLVDSTGADGSMLGLIGDSAS